MGKPGSSAMGQSAKSTGRSTNQSTGRTKTSTSRKTGGGSSLRTGMSKVSAGSSRRNQQGSSGAGAQGGNAIARIIDEVTGEDITPQSLLVFNTRGSAKRTVGGGASAAVNGRSLASGSISPQIPDAEDCK